MALAKTGGGGGIEGVPLAPSQKSIKLPSFFSFVGSKLPHSHWY